MVQLSRPFQAIVAALALFVLVWFVALHRPGSTSTGSGSSGGSSAQSEGGPSISQTSAHSATGSHAASASHGKSAHHATGTATRTPTHRGSHPHATNAHAGATVVHTSATAVHKQGAASHTHKTSTHTNAPAHAGAGANATHAPALQATVAAELKHGKTALLLFWNQRSSDDKAVRQQVQAVAHKLGHSVAVHTAAAGQVSAFGSITRNIQVYQTPTLLIVTPKGQVTTVTGYTDAYALEQTIREARG